MIWTLYLGISGRYVEVMDLQLILMSSSLPTLGLVLCSTSCQHWTNFDHSITLTTDSSSQSSVELCHQMEPRLQSTEHRAGMPLSGVRNHCPTLCRGGEQPDMLLCYNILCGLEDVRARSRSPFSIWYGDASCHDIYFIACNFGLGDTTTTDLLAMEIERWHS